jgi:hypothetical protein
LTPWAALVTESARAYRAIKATLPVGSVIYPPERNDRGQYLLWLTEAEANRLAAFTPTRGVVQRRGH